MFRLTGVARMATYVDFIMLYIGPEWAMGLLA